MDDLTDVQKEILTGCMLGDGNLIKIYGNQNSALRVGHCEQQKNYISWLHDKFKPFSLPISIEQRPTLIGFDKIKNSPIQSATDRCCFYVFRTINHPIFKEYEKSWYARDSLGNYILDKNKRRIKVVPQSALITPLSLAVWYFDDGTNLHNTNSKYKQRNAVLHTLSFTVEECHVLEKKINQLGIECKTRLNKNKPEILVTAQSYFSFIKMVEPHLPCRELNYKVDLSSYTPPNKSHSSKVNLNTINVVFNMLNKNISQKQIAKMLNLGEATISNIKNGRYKDKYNHEV